MRGTTWVWIIAIIIILAAGYYFLVMQPSPAMPNDGTATTTTTATSNTSNTSTATTTGTGAPMTATITYDGTTFSPRSVTIARGGTVTWVNNSDGNMWVASAQHPTHAVYDGTSRTEHCPNSGTAFDQCAGGTGNYSFKFDKTGSWNYHDHINATVFGTVVVQ